MGKTYQVVLTGTLRCPLTTIFYGLNNHQAVLVNIFHKVYQKKKKKNFFFPYIHGFCWMHMTPLDSTTHICQISFYVLNKHQAVLVNIFHIVYRKK